MIEKFRGMYTPTCDYCEKTLPGQMNYENAVAAILAAGWERRTEGSLRIHVCTDCQFEEKGYDKQEVRV